MDRSLLIESIITSECPEAEGLDLGRKIQSIIAKLDAGRRKAFHATKLESVRVALRDMLMLREFMVYNNLQMAMAEAIKDPAADLYKTNKEFKAVVDGLTEGIMRHFMKETEFVPDDCVTVITDQSASEYMTITGALLALGYEEVPPPKMGVLDNTNVMYFKLRGE